jgi:polyisoprenoid-binding protein YceI
LKGHEEILMKSVRIAGLAAAVVLAVSAGAMQAQAKDYKIDGAHSEADFAIKHMAISTVHGSFHGVSGVVTFDPANLSKSSVTATIDVSTVDTGVAARDNHLKSDAFFDVAKFPTITFKSTSVVKAGDHYDVTGELTIHGVTKSVVLKLEAPSKEQIGMDKKAHRGFTATTTVNRQDFGLSFAATSASGDAVLGDDVKIELDIDAAQV